MSILLFVPTFIRPYLQMTPSVCCDVASAHNDVISSSVCGVAIRQRMATLLNIMRAYILCVTVHNNAISDCCGAVRCIQYPDHVRTAASNVAKSLPPPPILLENEAAAANFVGKWGCRRHFLREKWLPMWSNLSTHIANKKHCIKNYLEYLVNLAAREEKTECSLNNLPPIKKNQDIQSVICLNNQTKIIDEEN